MVITPVTVLEFVDEAKSQDNCLREYISEVSLENTNISFIRQKSAPEEPHVVIEIQDGKIIQARSRYNTIPAKEDLEFIEKFARKYGLEVDLYQLISPDGKIPEGRENLESYLRELDKRSLRIPLQEG